MKYINLLRNVRNWPSYLSFRLKLNRNNPLVFRLKPVPIQLRMTRAMKPLFGEIFMAQVYEPALASIRTDTPVILDVGGNMGYFALYAFLRKPGARVFTFEPAPANFSYLEANKAANPGFDWQLYNSAVSDVAGLHDFFYDADYSPEGIDVSASLFSAGRISTVGAGHQRITVPVLNLPEWMKANRVDRCDVLKLDCEGAEYNIVYSMPDECFRLIRYIVADVHKMSGEKENADSLADYLRTKGYTVEVKNQELLYAERPV